MIISILNHTKSELGEGPTYDPINDTAWWFDIEGRILFEHNFDRNITIQHNLPRKASMLGIIDDLRQLVAMEDGLYIREVHSGALKLHHRVEADNAMTRSNDGRVHPSGALWFGTMGHNAEKAAGAIYHFLKGRLTKLYSEITIPNAICFSPDAKTAYFTDTAKNVLMHVSIDAATGLPISEAKPLLVQERRKGGLDGAIVDRAGDIWIAVWGASSL